MARRRYISTDISTDKRIALLAAQGGDFAVLLYTWMIPHADDEGGITADPDELKMRVIPGMKKTGAAISKAISLMVEFGLIEQEDDRLYFPSETFYRYQSYIKEGNRRESAENAGNLRNTTNQASAVHKLESQNQISGNQRKTPENTVSVTPSLSPSPSVPVSPSPSVTPSARPREKPTDQETISPQFSEVRQAFESRIGILPFSLKAEFERYERTTPRDWFLLAIDVTRSDADHPSWAFCRKVIDNALAQNRPPAPREELRKMITSVSDALAMRKARSNGRR